MVSQKRTEGTGREDLDEAVSYDPRITDVLSTKGSLA